MTAASEADPNDVSDLLTTLIGLGLATFTENVHDGVEYYTDEVAQGSRRQAEFFGAMEHAEYSHEDGGRQLVVHIAGRKYIVTVALQDPAYRSSLRPPFKIVRIRENGTRISEGGEYETLQEAWQIVTRRRRNSLFSSAVVDSSGVDVDFSRLNAEGRGAGGTK